VLDWPVSKNAGMIAGAWGARAGFTAKKDVLEEVDVGTALSFTATQ